MTVLRSFKVQVNFELHGTFALGFNFCHTNVYNSYVQNLKSVLFLQLDTYLWKNI